MVLNGHIDEKNQLWVSIGVSSPGSFSETQINAIIDTGFNGELLLPQGVAVPLGLPLSAIADVELANGSKIEQLVFSASVSWGTVVKKASVNVDDVKTPLIGTGLLHGYVLNVDFQKKTLTIKEPGTDEPQPDAGRMS